MLPGFTFPTEGLLFHSLALTLASCLPLISVPSVIFLYQMTRLLRARLRIKKEEERGGERRKEERRVKKERKGERFSLKETKETRSCF